MPSGQRLTFNRTRQSANSKKKIIKMYLLKSKNIYSPKDTVKTKKGNPQTKSEIWVHI